MAPVANIPKPIADALSALEQRIPGASTDIESFEGLNSTCYRIGVLAEHFRGIVFKETA